MKILIVEDNNKFRITLRSLLKAPNYEIFDVETGEEGLQFAKSHSFDLLLVDLVLPGINGLDMLREMRDAGNKFSVILMSAYLTDGIRNKAQEYGVNEFLEKPFEIAELTKIIDNLFPAEGR
jgi:DNA-binding response OmpR family regulator